MDNARPYLGLGEFWKKRNERTEIGLAKAVLALQNQQPGVLPGPCPIAREFEEKIRASVITRLTDNPGRLDIFNAKFNLQEEWQSWRRNLSAEHHGMGSLSGHSCLYEVYQSMYDALHSLESSVVSPDQETPTGTRQDISGLILGDEISEVIEETTEA